MIILRNVFLKTTHICLYIAVGMAGTGKSQVWKTLFRTYQNQKKKPHICDLNPKVI